LPRRWVELRGKCRRYAAIGSGRAQRRVTNAAWRRPVADFGHRRVTMVLFE